LKSYLQTILDCFSTMDVEGLRLYLKEDRGYQNASKETFIKKIEVIFEKLKDNGDTKIDVLSGSCQYSICSPELTRSGFRFMGNRSRDYFDLRFITEQSKDGEVADIMDMFTCNNFNTDEDSGTLGERLWIGLHKDERLDFPITPEYLIYVNKAFQAYEDLISKPVKVFDWHEVQDWLFRHKSTYGYILQNDDEDETLSWYDFTSIYQSMEIVADALDLLDRDEILDIAGLDSEDKRISKILQVERVLEKIICPVYERFELSSSGYFLNHWDQVHIKSEVVSKLGEWFNEWFFPTQSELVKKYFALNEADMDQIEEFDEIPEWDRKYNFLTTHLNIREKARLNGGHIPYFL